MSYKNRIITLTESLKLLNSRMAEISDPELLKEAIQQKITLEREIGRLQKLDWEETHERIDLDEDR